MTDLPPPPHPDRTHGLAPRLREYLSVTINNLRALPVRVAVRALGRALRRDPGLLEAWHATLTMTIYDTCQVNHARAWRASAAFLRSAFGVQVPDRPVNHERLGPEHD